MIVKLKNNWFGPTTPVQINKIQSTSGRRYRAGVHPLDDDLKDMLPTSAVIIEDVVVHPDPVMVDPEPSFKDFDNDRASSDVVQETNNAVHERLKKAREAKEEKARAAKAQGN